MKYSRTLAMLAGAALSLGAQSAFNGPPNTYVFDSSLHAIRAMAGVPGAALLGAVSGPAWDFLSVAPSGKRALGIAGGSIDLIPDLSNPAIFTSLGPAPGDVARIAWSSDSTIAALWSPRVRELWRITGLDGTPTVHNPIDLTIVGEVISGWTLSPDGGSAAVSGSTSVYLSEADAAAVPLAAVPGAGSIAFAPDGASLFVASGGAGQQIVRIDARTGAMIGNFDASSLRKPASTWDGRGTRSALRNGNQNAGIGDLAASPDGSRLYAIAGKTLCSYDLGGGTPSCQDLEITPASFEKMPGGEILLSYYRTGTTPLWLLDAKTGRVYFVPSGISTDNASN